MMCQRIGLLPISTMGLGLNSVSSLIRVPFPPQRITTFSFLAFMFIMIPVTLTIGYTNNILRNTSQVFKVPLNSLRIPQLSGIFFMGSSWVLVSLLG